MKRPYWVSGAGTLLLLMLGGGAADAASILTFDATGRGWIRSDLTSNGVGATNNYIAGGCCPGHEYRNFFFFQPTFTGTVTAARLLLDAASYVSPDPTETYQVTSLGASFGFGDLGTGTFYGSRVFSAADAGQTVSIPLNTAAIAAIVSGQTFRVGGRLTTYSGQTSQDEAVFWGSGSREQTRLELTLSDTAIPEPSSFALAGLGLLVIGLWSRRRKPAER